MLLRGPAALLFVGASMQRGGEAGLSIPHQAHRIITCEDEDYLTFCYGL